MATESILPLTIDHSALSNKYLANNEDQFGSMLLSNDFQASDDLLSELLATDQDFINELFDPTFNPTSLDSLMSSSPSLTTPSLTTPVTYSHDQRQHTAINGSPTSIDGHSPWSIGNTSGVTDYSTSPSTTTFDNEFFSNGFHGVDPNTGLGPPVSDTYIDLEFEDVESEKESDQKKSSSSERKTGSLLLTEEEKRLLSEEGIHLPNDMPLTKAEERHLKRIRRKIKNKQSAADSRKRKKEYVDGLEKRVEKCTAENVMCKKRIQALENENKNLLSQLHKLQALVSKYGPSKVQAGSFLMIFMMSFSFLVIPQYYSGQPSQLTNTGTTRTLLDISNVDEFGNIIDPITDQSSYRRGMSPIPPLPWKLQSPVIKFSDL